MLTPILFFINNLLYAWWEPPQFETQSRNKHISKRFVFSQMNIGWIVVGILSAIIICTSKIALLIWYVCSPILICSSKMLLFFKSFFAVLMSSLKNWSSNFVWVPFKLAPMVKWHYYWLESGISSNNTKCQIKPKAGRSEYLWHIWSCLIIYEPMWSFPLWLLS